MSFEIVLIAVGCYALGYITPMIIGSAESFFWRNAPYRCVVCQRWRRRGEMKYERLTSGESVLVCKDCHTSLHTPLRGSDE